MIPLGLAAATLFTGVMVSVRPGIVTVRLFQAVAVLLVVSGALGMYFHFRATSEFQLEMDPALAGWAVGTVVGLACRRRGRRSGRA